MTPTFAQLLAAGYTINEAVAILDKQIPSAAGYSPEPRDLDQEQAARDGQAWWKR